MPGCEHRYSKNIANNFSISFFSIIFSVDMLMVPGQLDAGIVLLLW